MLFLTPVRNVRRTRRRVEVVGVTTPAQPPLDTVFRLVPLFNHHVGASFALVPVASFRSSSFLTCLRGFDIARPIGMAIGLGLSSSYNRRSQTTMAVEGVLHALSAGILLYTGLVEVSLGTTSSSSLISALIRANLTVLATCARDPVQPKDDLGERGQGDVHLYVHPGRERDHGSHRVLGVKCRGGDSYYNCISIHIGMDIYHGLRDCLAGWACQSGSEYRGKPWRLGRDWTRRIWADSKGSCCQCLLTRSLTTSGRPYPSGQIRDVSPRLVAIVPIACR